MVWGNWRCVSTFRKECKSGPAVRGTNTYGEICERLNGKLVVLFFGQECCLPCMWLCSCTWSWSPLQLVSRVLLGFHYVSMVDGSLAVSLNWRLSSWAAVTGFRALVLQCHDWSCVTTPILRHLVSTKHLGATMNHRDSSKDLEGLSLEFGPGLAQLFVLQHPQFCFHSWRDCRPDSWSALVGSGVWRATWHHLKVLMSLKVTEIYNTCRWKGMERLLPPEEGASSVVVCCIHSWWREVLSLDVKVRKMKTRFPHPDSRHLCILSVLESSCIRTWYSDV